jgi:hypothetical protein
MLLAGALLGGCGDAPGRQVTEPDLPPAVVSGAFPWDAAQGETVEVRITGTGFTTGDALVWERNGSAAPGITVQQTTLLSDSVLVATVHIAPTAIAQTYDISVRSGDRRRGVGTEVFNVLHGTGSTLTAAFSFDYSGHRTGTFDASGSFVLSAETMFAQGARWVVTYYDYRWREQFFMAAEPRPDGWTNFLMCWSPGGRIAEPGTRLLECWLEIGTDFSAERRRWSDEQLVEDSYSSWIGSDRPADGSGRLTITEVTPLRLLGTFRITMHADYLHTLSDPGPTLLAEGSFDMPIVSAYFDQ